MFISASDAAEFLIERALITPADIIEHPIAITDAGRRCRNFKVQISDQKGFFIKQIRTTAPDASATLTREAKFFALTADNDAFLKLKKIVPNYRDFDEGRQALVLDLIPEAENLSELHFRIARFPPEIGELLGRGLGSYHAYAGSLAEAWSSGLFPAQKPWVLALSPGSLSPLDTFGPGVGPEMIDMLRRRPFLLAHLSNLGQAYQFDALVHGDMKWDNFVVFPATASGAYDFKVIDWELADVGDAAWDIAAIFGSYILYVLLSQSQIPSDPLEKPREDRQLANARPAMRRFWESYVETRGIEPDAARIGCLRTMTYLAGRLVLAVFEGLINRTLPLAQAEYLMTTAERIAIDPVQAAGDLLGPGAV